MVCVRVFFAVGRVLTAISKEVPIFFLAPSKLEDPHSFARKASTAIDSISAAVTCYDLYSIDPTQETKCAFS